MTWYNIFYKPKNNENMKDEKQYSVPKIGEIKENWAGVGENKSGGLGIRDLRTYIDRADVYGAMENLSKSKFWQEFANPYQKNIRDI